MSFCVLANSMGCKGSKGVLMLLEIYQGQVGVRSTFMEPPCRTANASWKLIDRGLFIVLLFWLEKGDLAAGLSACGDLKL